MYVLRGKVKKHTKKGTQLWLCLNTGPFRQTFTTNSYNNNKKQLNHMLNVYYYKECAC